MRDIDEAKIEYAEENNGLNSEELDCNHKEDYNRYWNEIVVRIKKEYIIIISEALEIALAEFKDKDSILEINIIFG